MANKITTNNNSGTIVSNSNGSNIFTTTTSNTTYISPSQLVFSPAYKPLTFSLSFSWGSKEVNVSLKKGEDVFKLAKAFMEWLDTNEIEYNVKTKGRKKVK